jgi:predicted PurR-regulated permease PerM
MLAFILIYLSYPVARYFRSTFKMSWRLSVSLFYLLMIVVLIGLLTLGGLALLEQGQSLFNIVQQAALVTLPNTINQLSTQVFRIGGFELDMRQIELKPITDQILGAVQPLLGQVGSILTKVAGGAASFLGWAAFVILIAYFVTAESSGRLESNLQLDIPGYADDLRRLLRKINLIWDTFLRGQLVLFVLTVIIYAIVLTALGVRYSLGIAFLTGFGRFLPYIGPAIAWITVGLVALFQGHTIFGLSPLGYVILVVGLSILIDSVFDNVVSPKFLGSTLQVHPAAVLLTALIAANMIGVVGVLVAAPVLATLQLLTRYMLRKMFDLDPWTGADQQGQEERRLMFPAGMTRAWMRFLRTVRRTPEP